MHKQIAKLLLTTVEVEICCSIVVDYIHKGTENGDEKYTHLLSYFL